MKDACLIGHLYYFCFATMYNDVWCLEIKKVKSREKGKEGGGVGILCIYTEFIYVLEHWNLF